MFLEVLRATFAIVFLLVLPGFFLTWAIFPDRRNLAWPTRALLTVSLSMVTVILVGAILGFLPPLGQRGWFQTAATGMPYLELTILLVTASAALVGYERGAFPRVRTWMERQRSTGSGAGGGESGGLHATPPGDAPR